MAKELFLGAAPAVICPMHEDGSVDYEAFDALIAHLVESGVGALVVNGTTGEASTLTSEEKTTLIKHAVKIADHRVPVIAGAGSNNTAAAITNALEAKAAGADALLLVTPYYNKASQRGLVAHFEAIVNEAKLPSILYTVPSRTGMNIAPETCAILADNPYIVGIKDAAGNLGYTISVLKLTQGKDFNVYSGEDGLVVPMMAAGAKGVISVTANVYPKAVQAMCEACLANDLQTARKYMFDLDQITALLFADVNPIPAKVAMAKLGYGKNVLRLPLIATTKEIEDKILAEMANLEARGY